MIIDLVLESGIAFGVSTRLTFEHNGTAVRKDEASPDEENARLPERDLTVVDADQLRALWDQEVAAARAVIDILRDLARDLAGQVGADASEESRRNDRSCLHDVFRGRALQPLAAHGAFVDRSVEERELAILHVLDRVGVDRWLIACNFGCWRLHRRCGCRGWRHSIDGC